MKLPDLGEQARPTPTPSGGIASYQPQDAGSAMAPGLAVSSVAGELGREAEQWIAKEKARVDTMMVEDATAKLRAAQQDLKMGKDGFINQRGVEALKKPLLDDYGKRFESIAGELSAKLTPDQQAAFRKRTQVYGTEFRGDVMTHIIREGDRAEDLTFKARVAGEQKQIADNWNSGSAVATSIASIEGVARQYGQSRGWDAETIGAYISEQKGVAGTNIVQQAIADNNLGYAKDTLKQFKPDIETSHFKTLKAQVEAGDKQAKALTYSDDLFAGTKGYKAQMDRVQQDFAGGKIDAATRVAVEQRIDHKRAVGEQMKNDGDKAMMGSAQEWVLKNTGKSVLEMPPNLYAWAKNTGHLAGLDGFAQREGRPGERMSELKVRGALMEQAASDPDAFIAEFKKTAFADRFDLGTAGIKQMQDIAANMMQGTGKYKVGFDSKIMQDAIPKNLLASGKKDQRDAFVGLQHEAQIEWKKANPGKVPTIEEQKMIARAANAEYINLNASWYQSSKVKAYEVTPEMKAVPADFLEAIQAEAIKQKKPMPNQARILELWAKQKGGR